MSDEMNLVSNIYIKIYLIYLSYNNKSVDDLHWCGVRTSNP